MSNGLQFLLLLPTLRKATGRFDSKLLHSMLRYALPMLLLGLAGNFNNQADKILFPLLLRTPTTLMHSWVSTELATSWLS